MSHPSTSRVPPKVVTSGSLKSPVTDPEGPSEKAQRTQKKRNREPEKEESSGEESTSSDGDSSTDQSHKPYLAPAIDPDMMALDDAITVETSDEPGVSSDKADVESGKDKTPKQVKRKTKRARITSNNEESEASIPVTPLQKSKGKAKATSSEEPSKFITPTQKERSETTATIPSWLANSEEVTEHEKAAWEWAPKGVPPSGYDVPDIFGKEVTKPNQPQKMANFLSKYISDLDDLESQNKGVWAAHLYSTHRKKPAIIKKAIKEMFGDGCGVAQVENSVWSLVYSREGKSIAKALLEKVAIIQRGERRAIVFRSLALPTPRNFKIRQVRLPFKITV